MSGKSENVSYNNAIDALYQRYGTIMKPVKLDFDVDNINWMGASEDEEDEIVALGETLGF